MAPDTELGRPVALPRPCRLALRATLHHQPGPPPRRLTWPSRRPTPKRHPAAACTRPGPATRSPQAPSPKPGTGGAGTPCPAHPVHCPALPGRVGGDACHIRPTPALCHALSPCSYPCPQRPTQRPSAQRHDQPSCPCPWPRSRPYCQPQPQTPIPGKYL